MQTISWKDIAEERVNENIARKMFWGENVMVTRWKLAPNTVLPVHEHVSEQITMVEEGSVTISFADGEKFLLREGDMLVIPGSKLHGAEIGPHGGTIIDLFSPLRQDLIESREAYFSQTGAVSDVQEGSTPGDAKETDPYRRLHGFLRGSGIKVTLEELKNIPLDLLARYTYERQCITMGQLRQILGLDKTQAKALLREWKHGDDHSESSYRKMMERMIMLPSELKLMTPKSE
ncbi:MAG: cupin domain-containing protein [Desulfomonilaceae bacterium]